MEVVRVRDGWFCERWGVLQFGGWLVYGVDGRDPGGGNGGGGEVRDLSVGGKSALA